MSLDFLQPLFDWIALHPGWAGAAVFFIAFTESLAIIGLFMPGVVLMFGIGALVATGVMDFWSSFWFAVAGAVAGDGLSYWLGLHYKDRLRSVWPFKRYPELFGKGEAFFIRHGGKSILFGRFVGPVRPIVPLTAGMLGMGPWKFFSVNVLSALAWAPAYLIPGMVFGASLGLAAEVASRLAVLMVLLVALPWLAIWLLRTLYNRLAPHASEWSEQLLVWGRQHRYLGQITTALVDPRHPETKGLLVVAVGLLLVSAVLLLLFQQFSVSPALARLDVSVYHLLQGLRSPWADHVMVVVSQLGDSRVQGGIIVLVLLWLLWRRHWLAASHWLAMAGFATLAGAFLKQTLALPRPQAMYDGVQAFGFPSTHTLFAVSIFGFLAVLVARELPPKRRWLSYAVAMLLILSVAFSRLYLGAHWLSDVVGGLLLGLAWVLVLGVAFRRHLSAPLGLKGLLGIPLGGFLLLGGVHVLQTHTQQIERYTPQYTQQTLDRQQWLDDTWQQLPSRRIDSVGSRAQPLNIQVAGSLEILKEDLSARGWQEPVTLTPLNMVQWFNPAATPVDRPLLPQVHNGRHARLTLIQPEQQLLLRIWPADRVLDGSVQPVWLGYVGELGLRSFGLFSVPMLRPGFDQALDVFRQDVDGLAPLLRHRAVSEETNDWSGLTLLLVLPEQSFEK